MTATEGRGLEWIAPPPADRRQALLPVPAGEWPGADVVARDAHAGRRYLCPCGWAGWSAFGRARRHREACPMTPRPPRLTPAQARVLAVLEPYAPGTTWSRYMPPSWVAAYLWPDRGPLAEDLPAALPMAAGRVLRRLHAAKLVTILQLSRGVAWQINAAGLEALAADRARPRRIVTVTTTREA